MTAPSELFRRRSRVAYSGIPILQLETLRVLLLARMEEQSTRFTQYAVELDASTVNSSADTGGLGRALAALHMYGAREAIEEIEDALVRIEDDCYGTCELCDGPIPLQRLESIPQARFCAVCRPESASSADMRAASRVGPSRGEHTGALPPHPVCSPRPALRLSSSGSAGTRGARPLGEEIGDKEEDLREQADSAPASGVQPPTGKHTSAVVPVARDPLARTDSRVRDLSFGRHGERHFQPVCPACGPQTTAADAPDAVRRLVTLATRLLRRGTHEDPRRMVGSPTTPGWSALERVARLRDELHVTANRVARFDVDECPTIDPVQTRVSAATRATLAAERLLFQLDLAADRLIALLDPLSAHDWARMGQVGDGLVTLGELVDGVLHVAAHDLLDLLQDAPGVPPKGASAMTDAPSAAEVFCSLLPPVAT